MRQNCKLLSQPKRALLSPIDIDDEVTKRDFHNVSTLSTFSTAALQSMDCLISTSVNLLL